MTRARACVCARTRLGGCTDHSSIRMGSHKHELLHGGFSWSVVKYNPKGGQAREQGCSVSEPCPQSRSALCHSLLTDRNPSRAALQLLRSFLSPLYLLCVCESDSHAVSCPAVFVLPILLSQQSVVTSLFVTAHWRSVWKTSTITMEACDASGWVAPACSRNSWMTIQKGGLESISRMAWGTCQPGMEISWCGSTLR